MFHHKPSPWPTVAMAIFLLCSAASLSGEPSPSFDQITSATTSPGRWLARDGRPLPFRSDREVLEFLASAKVIDRKVLSDGVNRPLRVTLSKDGVEARAIFRTVDRQVRETTRTSGHERTFRDSYIFEVAAYEMSRLLGLDNVPPVVLRQLDGAAGSLQLWVEKAASEAHRLADKKAPEHPGELLRQKHTMEVFDQLIFNHDRNHGNMLVDARGKLWFVDPTRSFKRLPILSDADKVKYCERRFWEALKRLDRDEVRERLSPYLKPYEIDAVWKRQQKLIQHLDERLADVGESAVLFES